MQGVPLFTKNSKEFLNSRADRITLALKFGFRASPDCKNAGFR